MTFEEFKETYPFTKSHSDIYLEKIYKTYGPCVWSSKLVSQELCFFNNGFKYLNYNKEEYLEIEKINEHIGKYYTIKIKLEKIKGDFTND